VRGAYGDALARGESGVLAVLLREHERTLLIDPREILAACWSGLDACAESAYIKLNPIWSGRRFSGCAGGREATTTLCVVGARREA